MAQIGKRFSGRLGSGETRDIPCTQQPVGQYVAVYLDHSGTLTLCEAQVYGSKYNNQQFRCGDSAQNDRQNTILQCSGCSASPQGWTSNLGLGSSESTVPAMGQYQTFDFASIGKSPFATPDLWVKTCQGSMTLYRFYPTSTYKTTRNFFKETQKALADLASTHKSIRKWFKKLAPVPPA